ncbi:phospholipid scramblase-related protein [Desulfoluna spongiiphila]|uniref:phospholipid scramblase-related protein n=1 Tax=Desulfoluna spongiiphila TaxID=419481 RepID=UPI0012516CEF|nr:phospholipid scramblase-related protein [Desulfoluna spongiiphila]VVS93726.1 scramblase [Desulfoluna spongiiphila]
MPDVLSNNLFFVKEHVGMFKAASNFDIFDPESGDTWMECREEGLGLFTKIFRFTKYKTMTPFNIIIRDTQGNQLIRVSRGVSFFLSKVTVFDENDEVIGGFKQKFFSIGGAFNVLDAKDEPVCALKGKWTGWDFRFLLEDNQLAHVSKKWAGMGKELFTSADNYMLEISDSVPEGHPSRKLIVAAVMCIDLVLKE